MIPLAFVVQTSPLLAGYLISTGSRIYLPGITIKPALPCTCFLTQAMRSHLPNLPVDTIAFLSWLHSRNDYRGALYIRNVVLRYQEDQPAPSISFDAEAIMGFTPPRLRIAGVTLTPPGKYRNLKGVSPNDYPDPDVAPLPLNSGVKILFTYQFKLSPMMDNLQRLISGRWAPNAWAAIEYEILQTGLVRIATTGTAIPSQDVYINWKRMNDSRFDMLQNSSHHIQGFLNDTPGCADAPRVIRHTRTEFASDCGKI